MIKGEKAIAELNRFNRLYQSAIERSNFDNLGDSPAERVAVKIIDIGRRCIMAGPVDSLNNTRETVSCAASWFVFNNFEASLHWGEEAIRTHVTAKVASELLRRDK